LHADRARVGIVRTERVGDQHAQPKVIVAIAERPKHGHPGVTVLQAICITEPNDRISSPVLADRRRRVV
jgi:hypothetical protein